MHLLYKSAYTSTKSSLHRETISILVEIQKLWSSALSLLHCLIFFMAKLMIQEQEKISANKVS